MFRHVTKWGAGDHEVSDRSETKPGAEKRVNVQSLPSSIEMGRANRACEVAIVRTIMMRVWARERRLPLVPAQSRKAAMPIAPPKPTVAMSERSARIVSKSESDGTSAPPSHELM